MEIGLVAGVIIFLVIMWTVGYKKGFIRIALSLVVTIISLILALILSPMVSEFIKEKTPIYDTVKKQMNSYVSEYLEGTIDSASSQTQETAINKLNLPTSIKDKLISGNTDKIKQNMGVDKFSEYVSESLTDTLVNAVSILGLFIVIKLLLRVLILMADIISRLPIIHGINKSLGGIIGLAEGLLIIWVVCIGLTAISGTAIGTEIFAAIGENPILNFIYNNNLITMFIL